MSTAVCAVCGGPLTVGRCAACAARQRYRFVHRELVLLFVLIGVTVVAFGLTRAAAASNQRLRLRDAAAFFEEGRHRLQAGDVRAAVTALRRATAMDAQSNQYRLVLATALAADHEEEAAEEILANLRESAPEDPEVNLQLARLLAQSQDVTTAARYYQSALNALWNADRATRREVRVELIRFLLSHGQQSRALSEILILSANLSDGDTMARLEVGRLFLEAHDARLALDQFSAVLHTDATNNEALIGAGEAAFGLGDYRRASRYFSSASDSDRVRELRTLTDLVLSNDPLAPGLATGERTRRLKEDLALALAGLEACLATPDAQRQSTDDDLEALRDEVSKFLPTRKVSRPESRDRIDAGVELVFRAEHASEQACGSPTPERAALILIGRQHGFDER